MSDNIDGKVYAVRHGRIPGIYYSWEEAETQVWRFPQPEHKSFDTLEEAQEYLNRGSVRERVLAAGGTLTSPAGVNRRDRRSRRSQATASSSQASSSSSQASSSSSQAGQTRPSYAERIQHGLRREQEIAAANDRMGTLGVGDTMTIIRSASGFNFDITRLAPSPAGLSRMVPATPSPSSPSPLNSDDTTPSTEPGSADSDPEGF